MGKLKINDIRLSCELLLEHNEYGKTVDLLQRVSPNLGGVGSEEWEEFLDILERIPQTYRFESIEAATLYAKALKWLDKHQALFDWAAKVVNHHGLARAAQVQIEWASGLLVLRKYEQARNFLESAIPHLLGEALGIAKDLGRNNIRKSRRGWEGSVVPFRQQIIKDDAHGVFEALRAASTRLVDLVQTAHHNL